MISGDLIGRYAGRSHRRLTERRPVDISLTSEMVAICVSGRQAAPRLTHPDGTVGSSVLSAPNFGVRSA